MANKEIFEERESKTLEIKSTLPKFDVLIKTCIAFANGIGGSIIIGVEDQTREIVGVNELTKTRIFDEFPNSLFDSTSPSLLAQIYERVFKEKSVMIIHISPSLKKPCFQKREGIPKGVYLRVGSSTRRASEKYIEELMRESKRIFYDEEMIRESSEILSKDLLKSYLHIVPSKRRLMAEKIIAQSHVNLENDCPTVAGTLHFCENPEVFIPEAIIICSQFKGTSGRSIIQTQEIKGPLSEQAEVSLRLVESWISQHFKLHGIKLKGELSLPREALTGVYRIV